MHKNNLEIRDDISNLLTEIAKAMWNNKIDEDKIKIIAAKYNIDFDLGGTK